MKQELQLQLINDFPILYGQKGVKSEERTRFSYSGFEIEGDGWEPIIRDLSAKLEKLNKQGYIVQVQQVKEKFGVLVVHFTCSQGLFDTVYDLYNEAQEQSAKTCEVCGEDGKLTDSQKRGWIRTLCEKHSEEHYK